MVVKLLFKITIITSNHHCKRQLLNKGCLYSVVNYIQHYRSKLDPESLKVDLNSYSNQYNNQGNRHHIIIVTIVLATSFCMN